MVKRILAALALVVALSAASAQAQHSGMWEGRAPMPTARSEISAALLDGRIYVAGGILPGRAMAAFEVYDPALDSWRALAPLPVARHHAPLAAAAGRVWLAGGYAGSFRDFLSDLWSYDPATGAWSRHADMPSARAAHAMAEIGGKLYVVGGVAQRPESVWVYDPRSNTWDASAAPLPTQREHTAAAALGGKLYVIAGRWSRGNLAAAEVYDPARDAWSTLPNMPTVSGGLTASAVAGRIHVTGGEDLFSSRTFSAHHAYDPATNRWETLAPLPTPRHGLASAGADGVFYVIGGATAAGGGTYRTLSDVVEAYRAE